MKKVFFFLFLSGLISFSFTQTDTDCGETPELNQKVIAFVKTKIKRKVGTGECWDLAAEALNSLNARWDGKYRFGNPVDPKTECIYPGDIVQFEGVIVKYQQGNMRYEENMSHHTAIIYEVKEKDVFTLAHQNIGTSGRKVGLTTLDLKNITRGKFQIYRPTL